MSVRNRNQLPNNLPQLQNLIKRDAESYKDEFHQQYQHFISNLEVFKHKPDQYSKTLDELIMFLAQISHCFTKELVDFPQHVKSLLLNYSTTLDPTMRMTMCRALILMRNKGLVPAVDVLELFFQLFRCSDKVLRETLYNYIVSDIQNVNSKHKNAKLNSTLQNFMFDMLKDSNAVAAKKSLDVMIELYRRKVWKDAKTANVITTACFSKVTKIMVAAIKFFLGVDSNDESDSDSDAEDKGSKRNANELLLSHRVGKKTKKRQKRLNRALEVLKKHKKKKKRGELYNFSALHLIHDPQDLSERLFKQLEKCNEYYDVKIMMIDFISRLVGIHQLFLLNFYPYIQKFLQPRTKDVTKILLFAAQATHDLVPPDLIENLIKTVAYNFITERNSSDAIAVGLNAVKEITARCPHAMTEELVRDLAQYKNSREKAVSMASRGLIMTVRQLNPSILHKKDRGRITEAMQETELLPYGHPRAKDYLPGAEVLIREKTDSANENGETNEGENEEFGYIDEVLEQNKASEEEEEGEDDEEEGEEDEEEEEVAEKVAGGEEEEEDENNDGWEICSSEEEMDGWSDNDEGWIDVEHSEKEEVQETSTVKNKNDKKKNKDGTNKLRSQKVQISLEEKKKKAQFVSDQKIFSQNDFDKINRALVMKNLDPIQRKRKRDEQALEEEMKERGEILDISTIENIHKKRAHDKDSRLSTVYAGRDEREKFGRSRPKMNPNASKTNKEKKRNKNYMMVKHKLNKKQNKRSFRDKQVALRDALLKKQRTMRK